MPRMISKIDKAWFDAQRKEQGLSLRALAAKINMDPSALSRSLNAQRKLSPGEIRNLAGALGTSPADVLEHIDMTEATPIPASTDRNGGFGEMQQRQFTPKPKTVVEDEASEKAPVRHPIWGIWKGLVTLDPDYDYTQPADPDWGKVYED